MLIDAHTHISLDDLKKGYSEFIRKNEILSLVCGSDPKSAKIIAELAGGNSWIVPTYGLHPWHSGEYSVAQMENWIKSGNVLGEIGMDSVWCNVPLDIQEKVFIEQMEIAESQKIPVILHTKGEELRVAKILKKFAVPKLVHWYSSVEDLDKYIEMDCFFTIGPDCESNPAVKKIIEEVELNRLFVETDGLSALGWIRGKTAEVMETAEIKKSLENSIKYIAKVKKIPENSLKIIMEENLKKFLQ